MRKFVCLLLLYVKPAERVEMKFETGVNYGLDLHIGQTFLANGNAKEADDRRLFTIRDLKQGIDSFL